MSTPATTLVLAAAILDLARQKIGQKYVLGARAPMANRDWNGPWDCAELVSWCIFQVSGKLYGTRPRNDAVLADAYTGYWWEQSSGDGSRIPVAEALATRGAILLRRPGSARGHIAFSDGEGGTVEAHGASLGVCTLPAGNRRWDTGVLPPGIVYAKPLQSPEYSVPQVLLRVVVPLARGPLIVRIQAALRKASYPVGALDGIYGPQTAHAVSLFQNDNGLAPDGEAGESTLARLL